MSINGHKHGMSGIWKFHHGTITYKDIVQTWVSCQKKYFKIKYGKNIC